MATAEQQTELKERLDRIYLSASQLGQELEEILQTSTLTVAARDDIRWARHTLVRVEADLGAAWVATPPYPHMNEDASASEPTVTPPSL